MTIDKTPRSASTRKSESRVKEWQLPSTLDTPDAPEGYKFRWIRQSVRGYEDNKNVIGRIRQGYELVRADEFPDFDFPTEAEGKHKGIVSVGGLLLAKVPLEIAKQRNDYYKKYPRISKMQWITISLRTNILLCLYIDQSEKLKLRSVVLQKTNSF